MHKNVYLYILIKTVIMFNIDINIFGSFHIEPKFFR
jgi:hypothetical protein